jgi:hypothetical protein
VLLNEAAAALPLQSILNNGAEVAVTRYARHDPVTPPKGVVVTPADTGATGDIGVKESAKQGTVIATMPRMLARIANAFLTS